MTAAAILWALACLGVTPCLAAELADGQLGITKTAFGTTPAGRDVDLYTLTNAHGLEVQVLPHGARITQVKVPDRHGNLACVTLYLDSLDGYLSKGGVLGTVVGRYANRIAGAKFTLDGVEHKLLSVTGPGDHIHGGREGFHKLIWDAEPVRDAESVGVRLTHTSPDGHEGYPGTLAATVTYKLTNENELVMHYQATTDKPTHVNLTNHAYWNLGGADSGDVLGHVLTLHADRYLPFDNLKRKIPTGELRAVRGTVMDFTEPKTIGSRVEQVEGGNYDHCYVINKEPGKRLSLAARAVEPQSGRVMEVYTTQPGVQLYTGNRRGFCLETQHFPDSPNQANFPSTVLRPGETYEEITIHKFMVR